MFLFVLSGGLKGGLWSCYDGIRKVTAPCIKCTAPLVNENIVCSQFKSFDLVMILLKP